METVDRKPWQVKEYDHPIRQKSASDEYRTNYDKIFSKTTPVGGSKSDSVTERV
jgi:hypothetical protein